MIRDSVGLPGRKGKNYSRDVHHVDWSVRHGTTPPVCRFSQGAEAKVVLTAVGKKGGHYLPRQPPDLLWICCDDSSGVQ